MTEQTDASFSLTLAAGAQAFGDGSHPSTQGAIAALEGLAGLGGISRVLDLGCGNGILGLMAARHWGAQVIAADRQPEAIDAAIENARANGLQDQCQAVRSEGCSHPLIREHAPYDLILCNILAETLVGLAREVADLLAEEGLVVVAGILKWQADGVIEAYERCGLQLVQRLTVSGWVTLIWQRQILQSHDDTR